MAGLKGALLIVEDDAELRSVLVEILETIALKVDAAENGQEALQKILSCPYDCVFSDISMPEMDGFQLLEKTKLSSVLLPFVFISAFNDQKNLQKALKLGALDFINKPFDTSQIRAVAQRILNYRNHHSEIDQNLQKLVMKANLGTEEMKQIRELSRQWIGYQSSECSFKAKVG